MSLEAVRVKELQRGFVMEGTGSPITSLDFHREGEFLVAAAEDGAVHHINALQGKTLKKVYCKKYGVELVRFTHHEQSVLCTSRPSTSLAAAHPTTAHDIRYLSLFDNQYLRFFTGHEARVTALSMSYTDDRFLSASVDGTVRIWSLQQPKCLGLANIPTGNHTGPDAPPVLAAFDPSGMTFAVIARIKDRYVLKMYDSGKFSEGAFETFSISDEELLQTLRHQQPTLDPQAAQRLVQASWVDMNFSAEGNFLLVSTRAGLTIIMDAFEFQVTRFLTGYRNGQGLPISACYTPDAKHILTGSEEGDVCVFDTSSERVYDGAVHRLKGHTGPVRQVKCNPKYEVVASACSNVVLWIAPPPGK